MTVTPEIFESRWQANSLFLPFLCSGRGSKWIAEAQRLLYVYLRYMCEWVSTKRKIIFLVVSVCQVMSSQVCLYNPISYSGSQWAFRAHNSNGSEPELSKKTRRKPPENDKPIKNGTNFEEIQKEILLPLQQYVCQQQNTSDARWSW